MGVRRAISALLIVSGLGLCGLAARHYVRGWQAQAEGRRELARRASGVQGSDRPPRSDRPAGENPGIVSVSAGNSPGAPGGLPDGYPYGEPIARLKIPAAGIDAVVFGGADADSLEKGPGHVPGTELPGGHTGRNNCVITGHRDSHFRNLGWLRTGHEIELDGPAGTSRFRVVSREIVLPDAVRVLDASPAPRLTLITCYPFNSIGPAPQRLVVVAEPAPDPRPARGASTGHSS